MSKLNRKMKKQVDMQLADRQYTRDEEKRLVVNMTVQDDSNFLSVFSISGTPVISMDVAEFIENSTQLIPAGELLTLRVHSDCVDAQEQIIYEEAIKEYYAEKYIANERELKKNNRLSYLLAMMGIIVLALAILLDYMANSLIWAEVIDIVAWVFLWEAVDIRAFSNRSLKSKRLRYLAYMSMKVEYHSISHAYHKHCL